MELSKKEEKAALLSTAKPSAAICRIAVPATLALLAKAVYNITDTAYIGMLHSDTSLTAVGVTLPLLLFMVSIENVFAAGAAVFTGQKLGAGDRDAAGRVVSTIAFVSLLIGAALCVVGLLTIEPLMRFFGASAAALPEAKQYAFWMFIAALFNLPAQSLNCTARAESSARVASVAVVTGAALNVVLDPLFMFSWGLGRGVEGASLATAVSQFVSFAIMAWFYFSGRSLVKFSLRNVRFSGRLLADTVLVGIPSAVTQLCLAAAASMTNIAAVRFADADLIIAAYGVVQRLMLIGSYAVMGLMQGYQPVAAYAFGAGAKHRFLDSYHFTEMASLALTLVVEVLSIIFARPLIRLFNGNPRVIEFGALLLISRVALFPVFGLCYMMTITCQTVGAVRMGLFLSVVRQGFLYMPCILTLPRLFGSFGICLAEPATDALTLVVCLLCVRPMKRTAVSSMASVKAGEMPVSG